MFANLAENLARMGIERTAEQCRTKLKSVRLAYNKFKVRQAISGAAARRIPHQDILEQLLGGRPAANLHEATMDLGTMDTQTSKNAWCRLYCVAQTQNCD